MFMIYIDKIDRDIVRIDAESLETSRAGGRERPHRDPTAP